MTKHELHPYMPPAPSDHGHEPSQTIELRRLLSAMRRQRVRIILPMVMLGVMGMAYGVSKPDAYSATATMLLDDTLNAATRQAGGLADARATPDGVIENARIVMASNTLAYDVLDTTALQDDAVFLNEPRSPISTTIGQGIALALLPLSWMQALVAPPEPPDAGTGAVTPDERAVDPQKRYAAALLQRSLEVYRLGRSSAIGITYTSHDPAIAAEVANAYADAYRADILGANTAAVDQAEVWMNERMEQLGQQARTAAQEAEHFATRNRLALTPEGALLGDQAQTELNASLTEAIGDSANAEATLSIFDRVVADGVEGLLNGNSIRIGADDLSEQLLLRLDNFKDLQSRLQNLKANAGPDHPQVPGLEEAVRTSAARLFVELQGRRQTAADELEVAEARVAALRDSLNRMAAENAGQAAALVRLKSMQQEAQTLSTLYQDMLSRSQEIRQQSSFPIANVRVLAYAEAPRQPSGPATLRYAVAAALLGLFLGLCWAVRREMGEKVLHTAEDVTDHSHLRFLGHLPPLRLGVDPAPARSAGGRASDVPMRRPLAPPVNIPVLQHPESAYAETLRHVRLAAQGLDNDPVGMRPVLAVTSFGPSSGRASVALNLAGQIADGSRKRVLLIDADVTGRALSRLLRLDDAPGFTDLALPDGDWQAALRDVEEANLTVLPVGRGNPDGLLSARIIRRILAEAQDEFAAIVVDVPALHPTAQGVAMLYEVPAFVVVGDWGRTPRVLVETALENHPRLEKRCLGVVYDRVDLRRLRAFTEPRSSERLLLDGESGLLHG